MENDEAQKELIKQDAVPVIVKCASEMQFDVPTVQQPSLECLWTMAFTPDGLTKLIESPGFLNHLKKVRNDFTTIAEADEEPSNELAKVADGLLWKIEKEPVLLERTESTQEFKYDIMISYEHGDTTMCEQIYDRLTNQSKLRVWFDKKNMYGSVMDSMAEAVEKSEFVLICMSEAYKKSRCCRSEATYAYKLQRCIIPLKLHRDFRLSGWLAMTIGDLLYVDFTEKHPFDVSYTNLVEQIERHRRPEPLGMFESSEIYRQCIFEDFIGVDEMKHIFHERLDRCKSEKLFRESE